MRHKRITGWIMLVCMGALLCALLFGEQLEKVYRDIAYYLGERTVTEMRVQEYAQAHGMSIGDYPRSLVELLERNPETEDFVLNYPFRTEQEMDWSQYENQTSVPLFLQWDSQWGYEKYGSDMIAITGCGPTCVAMAGYWLTGSEDFTPNVVAEFSQRNGYYSPGSGSSWTLVSEGAVKLGLDVTEIPLVKKRIMDNLEVGNLIICAMGPGDFTTSGHYILMVGTENGQIRINDPNSRIRSAQLWSYEQIESQIRNLWVIRYFGE